MNPEGHSTSFLLGARQGVGEGRPETEEHIKGPESLLKPELEAAAGKEGLHLPTQCPVGSGPGRVGLALQARRGQRPRPSIPPGCTCSVILTLVLLLVGLSLTPLLHRSHREQLGSPLAPAGPAQASAGGYRTPHQAGWRLSASFQASCTLWGV